MKKERTIKSLTDFINCVVTIKPNDNGMGLFPEELVFRGLSSKAYELEPSLGQRPSEHWHNSFQFVESDLISQAMQKFPGDFQALGLPIAILAKLQHFGIPTRLMDVTSSALVALYFACRTPHYSEDADGEVVVFSNFALSALNPWPNMIADTYRLTMNAETNLEEFFYRAFKQNYCISQTYLGWEHKIEENCIQYLRLIEKPLLVDSFENSIRQKNQQGKYIIFPNMTITDKDTGKRKVLDKLIKLQKNDPLIVKRIIVPADIKEDILKKLRLLGITKEFLFADNTDTVLRSVKERQADRYRNS